MALRTISYVPTGITSNKENLSTIPTKGAQNVISGPLTRQALGDVKNKVIKSRVPIPTKPVSSDRVEDEAKDSNPLPWKNSTKQENLDTKAQCAFSSRLLPQDIPNVDKDDFENPQLCSNYVMDIFDYLRSLETEEVIEENFLANQTEITPRMRSILVDWLVQVHERFHLLQETLYLTVSFLDRFLQKQKVSKSNLQLLGVSAMFLAAKYEEMYAPEVNDFVYITDNAYKKREIFKMEMAILRTLKFNLGRPLPLHFLRRYSKVADCNATTHTLAKYLMELSLSDYAFAHYNPSILAASALNISLKCLLDEPWNAVLEYYTAYQEKELQEVNNAFAKLLQNAEKSKLQAVRKKYASSKFMNISLTPELTFIAKEIL